MDILIKGMKLPKSCEECWMTYEGDSENCPVVNESVVKYMVEEKRHPNCPLVALPPHGRLGDLDLLEEWMRKKHKENDCPFNIDAFLVALKKIPTIVEASR